MSNQMAGEYEHKQLQHNQFAQPTSEELVFDENLLFQDMKDLSTLTSTTFYMLMSLFPTWSFQIILQPVVISQLAGWAQWSVDLNGGIEFRVVDLVALLFTVVGDDRLEAMSPQDLAGQVAAARLRRLPGRFNGSLENHDDFEALLLDEVARWHVVERRVLVDFMAHDHRPNEKQITRAAVSSDLKFALILADYLTLFRHFRFNQLRSHIRANDVTLSHIADSKHER